MHRLFTVVVFAGETLAQWFPTGEEFLPREEFPLSI